MNELHTTHSWDFLGVNSLQYKDQVPSGSICDVIVGVIDSGTYRYHSHPALLLPLSDPVVGMTGFVHSFSCRDLA